MDRLVQYITTLEKDLDRPQVINMHRLYKIIYVGILHVIGFFRPKGGAPVTLFLFSRPTFLRYYGIFGARKSRITEHRSPAGRRKKRQQGITAAKLLGR